MTTQAEVVAKQTERVALIQVGAALEARDTVVDTVRKYSDQRKRAEKVRASWRDRGAPRLRAERDVKHVRREVNSARRDVESPLDDLRSEAWDLVEMNGSSQARRTTRDGTWRAPAGMRALVVYVGRL